MRDFIEKHYGGLSPLWICLTILAATLIATIIFLYWRFKRFRFTLRDLLWLTVVVALAVGWWLEHRLDMPAKIKQLEFSLKRIERNNEQLREFYEAERAALGPPWPPFPEVPPKTSSTTLPNTE